MPRKCYVNHLPSLPPYIRGLTGRPMESTNKIYHLIEGKHGLENE